MAGLSNPQLVGLVRRRHPDLPLGRGRVIVFACSIFVHLVPAVGPSERALAVWTSPMAVVVLGMTASLRVERG